MPVAVINPRAPRLQSPRPPVHHFATGLERHGWSIFDTEGDRQDTPPCDLVVFWGVRNRVAIEDCRKRGIRIVVLERGYVGNRHRHTAAMIGGGLNGAGRFAPAPSVSQDRFNAMGGHLHPWRPRNAGLALICGQVNGDMSIAGINTAQAYDAVVRHLTARGIEVHYRPHPLRPEPFGAAGKAIRPRAPVKIVPHQVPIAEQVKFYDFTVSISSNSGVDSVMAGVPHLALDPRSMVYGLCGEADIASDDWTPPQPFDRAEWAASIAWKQWTDDELASGFAWDHLRSVE